MLDQIKLNNTSVLKYFFYSVLALLFVSACQNPPTFDDKKPDTPKETITNVGEVRIPNAQVRNLNVQDGLTGFNSGSDGSMTSMTNDSIVFTDSIASKFLGGNSSLSVDTIIITDTIANLYGVEGTITAPVTLQLQENEIICKSGGKIFTVSRAQLADMPLPQRARLLKKYSEKEYSLISPNRNVFCFKEIKGDRETTCYSILKQDLCVLRRNGYYEVYAKS